MKSSVTFVLVFFVCFANSQSCSSFTACSDCLSYSSSNCNWCSSSGTSYCFSKDNDTCVNFGDTKYTTPGDCNAYCSTFSSCSSCNAGHPGCGWCSLGSAAGTCVSSYPDSAICTSFDSQSCNICTVPTKGSYGSSCQSTADCFGQLSCHPILKYCFSPNIGDSCTDSSACGSYVCLNGRCDAYRGPGDACDYNVQCYSKKCINQKCAAFGPGQACTGSDCAIGYFCSPTNNCVASLPVNGQCGTLFNQLISYSMNRLNDAYALCSKSLCNGTNCIAIFNNPIGTPCSSSVECSVSAPYCNPTTHVCQAFPGQLCTNLSPCSVFGYTCSCSSSTAPGTCAQDACATNQIEYYQCIFTNCLFASSPTTTAIPGTCVSQCRNYELNYQCCLKQHNSAYWLNPATQAYCNNPTVTTGSGFSTAVVSGASSTNGNSGVQTTAASTTSNSNSGGSTTSSNGGQTSSSTLCDINALSTCSDTFSACRSVNSTNCTCYFNFGTCFLTTFCSSLPEYGDFKSLCYQANCGKETCDPRNETPGVSSATSVYFAHPQVVYVGFLLLLGCLSGR